MKVLLVDQNVELLRMNARLLRGEGHVVHTIESADLSSGLPAEHYDVVIAGSLNGLGVPVLSSIDADKGILYSGNPIYGRRAEAHNFKVVPKSEPILKVVRRLC